jgi:diguanylate cyclase (GGDEF)-like protein
VRKLEQSEEEISRRNRQLEYLANHDPLSGCLNRRAFFAKFETNLQTAHRDKVPMSCLMVDLDHFKSINDRFGHSVGDQVITNVADILKTSVRDQDLVGRYGGEEFCVALYDLSVEETRGLAERIRKDIEAASVAWLPNGEAATSSLGFAMRPDEYTPDTAMALVELADQALYVAKETGRNQVVFYDEIPEDAKKEGKKEDGKQADHAVPEKPAEKHLRRATDKLGLPTADVDVAALINQQLETEKSAPAQVLSSHAEPAFDPVTQLPNRVIFMDRVTQSIARARRSQSTIGVLQISVDAFEKLTDLFGEEAVSEIIAVVGNRLVKVLRRSDTVSLVGGGDRVPTVSRMSDCKFAIEVSDVDKTDTIIWIVKRIFESLAEPFEINEEKIYINCSIGVSVFPEDGEDAETLVRNASTAERHARETEGNGVYMFFSREMNENSRRQIRLEAGLRKAIEADQFSLFYQPIVSAQTGKLTSAEALLRCSCPDVSDAQIWELIAVAEQTGLMAPIGEWVMRTATAQLADWRRSGIDLQKISVNCSAIQLRDPAAVESLLQIITNMELPTQHLQVEITETAMLQNIDAASDTLKKLQQLGVQIALDDFGTGQSSMTYLRRFRPDIVKIDRSFISEIDVSSTDETMVSAIIAMSHRMSMGVVAEGIETLDQMEKLSKLGCDEVQGYGIARPMPVGAMTRWLKLFTTETGLGSTPMHQQNKVA